MALFILLVISQEMKHTRTEHPIFGSTWRTQHVVRGLGLSWDIRASRNDGRLRLRGRSSGRSPALLAGYFGGIALQCLYLMIRSGRDPKIETEPPAWGGSAFGTAGARKDGYRTFATGRFLIRWRTKGAHFVKRHRGFLPGATV